MKNIQIKKYIQISFFCCKMNKTGSLNRIWLKLFSQHIRENWAWLGELQSLLSFCRISQCITCNGSRTTNLQVAGRPGTSSSSSSSRRNQLHHVQLICTIDHRYTRTGLKIRKTCKYFIFAHLDCSELDLKKINKLSNSYSRCFEF